MTDHLHEGKAALLGVVQGLTEFLPISSSGHLVIFQHFLGLKTPELLFDVIVHAGTLIAVLIVYRQDLWLLARDAALAGREIAGSRDIRSAWQKYPHFRLAAFILAGSVPAGLAGLLLQAPLERAFGSLVSAGGMLLITGTVLFFTRKSPPGETGLDSLGLRESMIIGTAQAAALLPGISRSGMTIATGLFCGLSRDLAARFSFLLSIPAILGANLLQFYKAGGALAAADRLPFLLGGIAALGAGYLALIILLRIVHQGRLHHFSYYCWALGTLIIFYSLLGRAG